MWLFEGGNTHLETADGEYLRFWTFRVPSSEGMLLIHGTGAVAVLHLKQGVVKQCEIIEGPEARERLARDVVHPSAALRKRVRKACAPGRSVEEVAMELYPYPKQRRWLQAEPPTLSMGWSGAIAFEVKLGRVAGHQWITGEDALALMEQWSACS